MADLVLIPLLKIIVVLNATIVGYLAYRLWQRHQQHTPT